MLHLMFLNIQITNLYLIVSSTYFPYLAILSAEIQAFS